MKYKVMEDYWIQQVKDVMNILSPQFQVSDVSYSNDLCPSILINEKYLLFLPNNHCNDPSNGSFNTYNLILDEEYAFDKTFNVVSKSLNKIIKAI